MLTNSRPKVSILVPVYNAQDFISETINAVLAQTFKDFELILLDDASVDNTANIIKKFMADDVRIIYHRNEENLGISASRNKLLDLAQGEYSAVLDHDDICLPQRLERQVAYLDKHNDVDMIGSRFELFCPPPAPLWRRLITNLGWVWCHPAYPSVDDLLQGNVMMHPTIMYRTDKLQHAGLRYRQEYSPAEDYDLVRQAMLNGFKLYNMPDILLKYRLYGGNQSLQKKQAMQKSDALIKCELAKLLNKENKLNYPYWRVMLKKLRLKFLIKKEQ